MTQATEALLLKFAVVWEGDMKIGADVGTGADNAPPEGGTASSCHQLGVYFCD